MNVRGFLDLLMFRAPPPVLGAEEPPPARPAAAPVPQAVPAPPAASSGKKKALPAAIMAMVAATIAMEGGYVNNPKDPGGETNMGITKKVAQDNGYAGPMRTLPRATAESIYYEQYIVVPGYEPLVEVNAPVVAELFDTGVNMGPLWPSKWLQQSLNEMCGTSLKVDGVVGKGTRDAFVACQNKTGAAAMCVQMLDRLDAKQKARYYGIVKARPSSQIFLKGWLKWRIGNVDRKQCQQGAPA